MTLPRSLLLTLLVTAACAAPADAASIWTEVPSGTTSNITAIEYQSDERFWFATADGSIYRRTGDGFTREHGPTGVSINDIEFQAGAGTIGMAVGNGGQVWRSTNGGDTWASVTGIPVSDDESTFVNCKETRPLGDVYSVRFAGNDRVWIFAQGSQVARSQPASPANVGATGTWVDANRDTRGTATPDDDTCKLHTGYGDGYADGFFVPENPDVGYIVGAWASEVFFTTNNLASAGQKKPADAGNAGGTRRTLVGDPANPNRLWAAAPEPYGRSTTSYTQDGYATEDWWRIGNADRREFPTSGPWDVDFAGGTVLSAGDAGMVLNSIDGVTFYYNDADGSLATHDWRAVGLASATQGAIGGIGGKLALTTQANFVPDLIKPTGTIAGPSTGTAGQPLTFTAQVNDTGGSGMDPNGYSWTVEGLAGQTGPSATFTFPNPGFYTVRLSFRDLAGNSNTATKSVQIAAGALPLLTLPSKAPAKARRKGKRVIVTVKGTIGRPAGMSAAEACTSAVRLTVRKGTRTLAVKNARPVDCVFKKKIKIKRKFVGKAKKLKLIVAVAGNSRVRGAAKSYTVKVKRR